MIHVIGWVNVCNEQLHRFAVSDIFSGGQVKENKVGGACSVHRRMRYAYTILAGKHERKISFGGQA
jgi:hypothetical protein